VARTAAKPAPPAKPGAAGKPSPARRPGEDPVPAQASGSADSREAGR
jgi:hypothetical protein